MEIFGKIVQLLPEKSGTTANGEWRKREYVLETGAQYPKKICFMVWGDKIDQFSIQQGENLKVSIDLESREYNDRWYTDVKAWKVSRDESSAGVSYSATGQDDGYGSFESSPPLTNDEIPF
ncbi:MAG: DUF3127 domain-containing protein [Paracoccaceae bacterium]|nr:DUF3127 domain-containing protein [Paracoccaceae bacterium]